MYKRRNCKAIDGHLCNSVSELLIDNWLTKHHIGHAKEVPYPVGKYKTDWMLNQNTYIEYFGLAKDSKRYDADIKVKQSLCKKYKINLIEIYAKDLFPINLLHNKLKVIKSSQ